MATDRELRFRLSRRERSFVLEYGYSFDDVWSQLDRLAGADGECGVTVGPFHLDHLLADLVRSMKDIEDRDLLEELDALYTNIEHQVAGQGYRP